jgi:hypothetical protein
MSERALAAWHDDPAISDDGNRWCDESNSCCQITVSFCAWAAKAVAAIINEFIDQCLPIA